MDGVHHAISLDLHPHAIHTGTREREHELHLRAAVGEEWRRMHHVDQVLTGCQHVSPGAEISLETIAGRDTKPHLGSFGCLYEYRDIYRYPFLFRKPLRLPVGSVIRGVRGDAKIVLIPAAGIKR